MSGTGGREPDDAEALRARLAAAHHELRNALVGVRGHAQLLLRGPAADSPGLRQRLEVILRESERIETAAERIVAIAGEARGLAPSRRG